MNMQKGRTRWAWLFAIATGVCMTTAGMSEPAQPSNAHTKSGNPSRSIETGVGPAIASKGCDKHSSTSVAAAAGMVINLGPDGKPIQQVPTGLVKRAPSQGDLTVRPSSGAAGGLELQVGRRFVNSSVATIGVDGRVKVQCVQGDAVSTKGKE